MDTNSILISFCVGVGLAAATGFRVFAPLLMVGLAVRLGVLSGIEINSQSNLHWLGTDTALICFFVASLVEFLSYKIPIVDHFLDLLMSPLAVITGSLLLSAFLGEIDDPALKYGLAIIFGGGTAGVVQSATVAGRLLSSKTTAGLGNPIFAFIELVLATIVAAMSLFLPIVTALAVFVLITIIFYRFFKKKFKPSGAEPNLH